VGVGGGGGGGDGGATNSGPTWLGKYSSMALIPMFCSRPFILRV